MPDLLRNDYFFITRKGLEDFEAVLAQRRSKYFGNRRQITEKQIQYSQAKMLDPSVRDIIKPFIENEELEGFDDELPLSIQTDSLKNYIDELQTMQIREQ